MAGEEFVFVDRGKCLIGRSCDCDLPLPHTAEFCTVSRHHCLLEIKPDEVWVRDLGSRNGTYVNGLRISRSVGCWNIGGAAGTPCTDYELRNGDELSLADIVLRVGIVPESDRHEPVIDRPEAKNALALAEPCVN
jgi:serine/threonine-protein kinase